MDEYKFSAEVVEACMPLVCKIPLKIGTREFLKVLVKPGAKVKEGQAIARTEGTPAHYLHAPIPGIIRSFETVELPGEKSVRAVVIHLAGKFDWQRRKLIESAWKQKRKEDLFRTIHENGATNFVPFDLPPVDTGRPLVLTSCSYEPFLMTDHILLQKHMDQIIQGAEILARMYRSQEVIFALPREPLPSLEQKIKNRKLPWKVMYIRHLSPVYFLNDDILVRKIHEEYSSVHNPHVFSMHFVHAVYENIALSRPVMERIVAVGGEAVHSARFVQIRLGASVAALFQECGGWKTAPEKLVAGGLLTGKTIVDMGTPVSSDMSALFALTEKEIFVGKQIPCIQCGNCVQTCPVYLHPLLLYKLIQKQKIDEAERFGLSACVECGLCAQVCPSRLPLSSIIMQAKKTHVTA